MTTTCDKLRAAHSKALATSRDPDLLAAVCNSCGSVTGKIADVPEERQPQLLATFNRMAAGNKSQPVAFASIARGAPAPMARVYVDDDEIDEDDAEYVAERIANPLRASARKVAMLDPVAIFAKWNAAKRDDDA